MAICTAYIKSLLISTAMDVDVLDLADFADSWLKIPGNAGYDSRANLYADSSGIVDSIDFAAFASQWKPVP